jgi:hypothetical protein
VGSFLSLSSKSKSRVAEPVYFCAAPAPACQNFLVQAPAPTFFTVYFGKNKVFPGFKKFSKFLMTKLSGNFSSPKNPVSQHKKNQINVGRFTTQFCDNQKSSFIDKPKIGGSHFDFSNYWYF